MRVGGDLRVLLRLVRPGAHGDRIPEDFLLAGAGGHFDLEGHLALPLCPVGRCVDGERIQQSCNLSNGIQENCNHENVIGPIVGKVPR